MQRRAGFIYIWMDTKRKKFYIGSHLGTFNDGYIGSNARLISAYKSRPDTFKRRILESYSDCTSSEILQREGRWLALIQDDELGTRYYNEKKVAAGGDIVSLLSDEKRQLHRYRSNSAIRQIMQENPLLSIYECATIYDSIIDDRNANKNKPGETWSGRSHSLESKQRMAESAKTRGYCRDANWKHTESAKQKVSLNNPNRKCICTPNGKYNSAEEFANKTKIITANGLRGILNDCDKIITKHRATRCPLFTTLDVGKTPRDLGYYYDV